MEGVSALQQGWLARGADPGHVGAAEDAERDEEHVRDRVLQPQPSHHTRDNNASQVVH